MTSSETISAEQAAHRAAVEAGYATLGGYVAKWRKPQRKLFRIIGQAAT